MSCSCSCTSHLNAIHEMSSSCSFLQPSPFTPDQFVIAPPPTINPNNNTPSRLPEGFIQKRPLQLSEELIAGRIVVCPSRPRLSPAKTISRRPTVEEFPPLHLSTAGTNPVTPPPKHLYRIPNRVRDTTPQSRSAGLICCSSPSRRRVQKTRSPKSRRSCTPSSSNKSPSLCSPRAIRANRPPLVRWTPLSVSTCGFYTPESTHYPVTPPSNAASVMIATNCPWTVSSSSSSPYSPQINH